MRNMTCHMPTLSLLWSSIIDYDVSRYHSRKRRTILLWEVCSFTFNMVPHAHCATRSQLPLHSKVNKSVIVQKRYYCGNLCLWRIHVLHWRNAIIRMYQLSFYHITDMILYILWVWKFFLRRCAFSFLALPVSTLQLPFRLITGIRVWFIDCDRVGV